MPQDNPLVFNRFTRFNKNTNYCKQVGYGCFAMHLDSLINHRLNVFSCSSIFFCSFIRYEQL